MRAEKRRVIPEDTGTSAPLPAPGVVWARDSGSIYTALETISTADRLHLVPITTPPSSPQANGMSEAFVNTVRRSEQAGADLSTA